MGFIAVLLIAVIAPAAHTETLLKEFPLDLQADSLVYSLILQDGRIVCTAVTHPDDFTRTVETVWVDGSWYGPFTRSSLLGFTPDGKPLFSDTVGDGRRLVAGGGRFDGAGRVEYASWSGDGKSSVLVSRGERGLFVHTSGQAYGPFDDIPPYGLPRFPAGSGTAVWIAEDDGSFSVHIGKASFGPWTDIWDPIWSADGSAFAIPVSDDGGQYLLSGSGLSPRFELLADLRFPPAGTVPTFSVLDGGKYRVFSGGKQIGRYDEVRGLDYGTGGALTYVSRTGRETSLHAGSASYGPYEEIGSFRYGTDGKTLAWSAKIGDSWYVCCGEAAFGPYEAVESLCFLPDGRTPLYSARRAGSWYLYGSGARQGPYKTMELVQPVEGEESSVRRPAVWKAEDVRGLWYLTGGVKLGPFPEDSSAYDFSCARDGKTFVYCAEIEGTWYLMKGNTRLLECELPGDTEISPDGKTIFLRYGKHGRLAGILLRGGKEMPGSFVRDRSGNITGVLTLEKGKVRRYAY